jgi:rhodanese-related sulfurtransferase
MRKVYAGLSAFSALLCGKEGGGLSFILTMCKILPISALFIASCISTGYSATKSVLMESVSQQLKNRQDITLVDVRDAGEFEKFRIPGSINIPLFAIKTKTFLKSKPLVLINNGQNYKQLTDECTVLSKAGFIVSMLDGGLYQWKRKNGRLEGDVFAQKELNYISLVRI